MALAQKIDGHEKDLGGGFLVRRLLPAARQRSVGPFIFFDHFGPAHEAPEADHDVRPHPHIGLATVTYLFEGAMMHRDSLGTEQLIEPGAINWMTAGKGIVHSERKPAHLKSRNFVNHGLQLWAALPLAHEEAEPAFSHTPADSIPEGRVDDAIVRVLVGEAFRMESPVRTLAPTLYLDLRLLNGGMIELQELAPELAVYSLDQDVEIDGVPLPARVMGVLDAQDSVLRAPRGARVMVIGGAPLDGPRHMWWNFVSSRKDRIIAASAAWEAQRMGRVAGDISFIPLPEVRFSPTEPSA
jgi:redox-sensitive bicupin YhaK (pirin superfamily)